MVVLTGAGISTESGIKDFRSRTGIYKMAPEYILSIDYFYKNPKEFYQFAVENLYHPEAIPNKGHEILAKWESAGKVSSIITQNIDGLHQKAGSQNVIEFHGTMKTASCQNCGKIYPTEEMIERLQTKEDFYVCDYCKTKREQDRYIKPDVVLFGDTGEWFTEEGFTTIIQTIQQADCLLVLGTSLKVTPFSSFPQYRNQKVPLIIINQGDTPYDNKADTFLIHESIGATLVGIDGNL
jgi:NAD-dependent deacetylase